jgi:class 3 adenylate cyclase/CHASE2 domain-containing sensor protein
VAMVVGAFAFRGENALERIFIDLRFFIVSSLRASETQSDRIVVVRMDRRSETGLNVPFGPSWRQFYPAFIQKLRDADASVIAFDSMFVEHEAQWDPAFAAACGSAGNVVAGEQEGAQPTAAALRGAFAGLGSLAFTQVGAQPRAIRLPAAGSSSLRPLALVAVNELARQANAVLTADPAATSNVWIDYREAPSFFPRFSFCDVLAAKDGRLGDALRTPMSVFAHTIVFVGLDDPASGDFFAFPNTRGKKYPGVYGQAFAANTIMRGSPITRASPWADAGITLAFACLLLLVLEIRVRPARVLALVLMLPLFFSLYTVLLSGTGLWLGFAPLFVSFWAVLILHWVLLRVALNATLSKAVGFDPRLIEAFRRESARAGGVVRKKVAILIADVRDYTRYVSVTDPATVSTVMGEYMEAMERCITSQGGYVNKYVGDEIVAVFGFPVAEKQESRRALRAAITMLDELGRLRTAWKERGLVCIERIGIGLDTGEVVFAEVGGRTKSQFDIIGDAINGASRIEHLTKEFKRELLVSEEIAKALEGDDELSGCLELVKSVSVRGQGERRILAVIR